MKGPTWSRTLASVNSSSKDDVTRTATGEVQKQNNFASEVEKKMQEITPGGDPAESASNEKGEQTKQKRDKAVGSEPIVQNRHGLSQRGLNVNI